MSPLARELAQRRETLIADCEAQRLKIAEVSQPLKSASQAADRVLGIARYVREHPLLVGVAVALAMIAIRSRLLRWVGLALPMLSAGLRVGRALRKF
jgi:hypothetical protein